MMLFYWSAQECWKYLASDWNWIGLMNSKWSKMDWTWIDEHETLTRKSFPIYGVSCEDEFELEMLRLCRKNKTLEHLFRAPSGNEFVDWKSFWTAPGTHDMSSWKRSKSSWVNNKSFKTISLYFNIVVALFRLCIIAQFHFCSLLFSRHYDIVSYHKVTVIGKGNRRNFSEVFKLVEWIIVVKIVN